MSAIGFHLKIPPDKELIMRLYSKKHTDGEGKTD